MNAFGLTGNIGCGKTKVAELLAWYRDVAIINCDSIAKDIMGSGTHRCKIAEILLGDSASNWHVDSQLIAQIIFKDPDKKRRLEEFIHPLVWREVELKVSKKNRRDICIVESAIIFETKTESKFLGIITASCGEEEQYRRLRTNRGMTDEQIRARLVGQIPQDEKELRAQFVVHTDCGPGKLEERVERLYRSLKQHKQRKEESHAYEAVT